MALVRRKQDNVPVHTATPAISILQKIGLALRNKSPVNKLQTAADSATTAKQVSASEPRSHVNLIDRDSSANKSNIITAASLAQALPLQHSAGAEVPVESASLSHSQREARTHANSCFTDRLTSSPSKRCQSSVDLYPSHDVPLTAANQPKLEVKAKRPSSLPLTGCTSGPHRPR